MVEGVLLLDWAVAVTQTARSVGVECRNARSATVTNSVAASHRTAGGAHVLGNLPSRKSGRGPVTTLSSSFVLTNSGQSSELHYLAACTAARASMSASTNSSICSIPVRQDEMLRRKAGRPCH